MTTLYRCDWCERSYEDREKVASLDITIGTTNTKAHQCAECAPDWLKSKYPA